MAPVKMGVNIGLLRDKQGRIRVGLELFGDGHASICLTAKAARIYADALNLAADKLEEAERKAIVS